MNSADYYSTLIKPFFAPPPTIFGPVWTFLYILIAISYGYVAYLYVKKEIKFAVVLPFILNLVVNLVYSPIAFGLQNLVLAAIDVVLVLGTLIWALWKMYPISRTVVFMNIPYLLWVSFATILQLSITFLNM